MWPPVFAESEVVSLVAQNKDMADIIHGLNVSCLKSRRVGSSPWKGSSRRYILDDRWCSEEEPVSSRHWKRSLSAKLYICDEAQLCGALGGGAILLEM